MSFQKACKISLSSYKKEILGVHDPGVFRYRGNDLFKDHILPTDFRNQNIIRHYRDGFFASSSSVIDYHRYFHHLNSSQALCINFFYPLMVENKLNIVLDLLGMPESQVVDSCFEKESDLEIGSGRKTNFDYFMQLINRTKIYFEIKYSEAEFGSAKKDEEHKRKFAATYQPLLKNNIFIDPRYCEMNSFLNAYQIMRNISHINEKSLVVFVYPRANKKIHLQAQSVSEKLLTDKGKSRYKILLLESAIKEILHRVQIPKLNDHYLEFKHKYLSCDAT